jgi:hypothetical protein
MSFYAYCKKCKHSDCCSVPFFAFVSNFEKEKIIKYLKSIKNAMKDEKLFEKFKVEGLNGEYFYKISKKNNGKCIFLRDNKSCLIQNVKPLDCILWPLTFDYMQKTKEIIIYIGNCFSITEMKRMKILNNWIQDQKKLLLSRIKEYSTSELIAYTSLYGAPNLRVLESILV